MVHDHVVRLGRAAGPDDVAGWQPRNAASFSRASAWPGSRACRPGAGLDGLPPIFQRGVEPGFARLAHHGRGGVVIEVNHRPDRIRLAAALASFLWAAVKASRRICAGDFQTPPTSFGLTDFFVKLAKNVAFQRDAIARNGMFDGGKRLESCSGGDRNLFETSAASFASNFPLMISTFGNSHKCAFTTPAGRWRTRNFRLASTTNATNRRAVAVSRLPRFGNSSTRFSRNATQSFFTGQIRHCGLRGVQTSAPSSISDWLRCEQQVFLGRASSRSACARPPFVAARVSPHRNALNQFLRQLPKPRIGCLLLRIFGDAKNARQHADDIAVENRRGLVEGDAANRAGGVAADARQRENFIKIFRKFAAMLSAFHD
jgi:hypothetical protein